MQAFEKHFKVSLKRLNAACKCKYFNDAFGVKKIYNLNKFHKSCKVNKFSNILLWQHPIAMRTHATHVNRIENNAIMVCIHHAKYTQAYVSKCLRGDQYGSWHIISIAYVQLLVALMPNVVYFKGFKNKIFHETYQCELWVIFSFALFRYIHIIVYIRLTSASIHSMSLENLVSKCWKMLCWKTEIYCIKIYLNLMCKHLWDKPSTLIFIFRISIQIN